MASPFTKVVANFSTTLVTAITAGGTSATLGGNTTKEGVALPTGKYCLTVNQGKSNEQHFVCDLTGTAITNIQGVDRLGNVTTGALKDAQINDEVKITDYVNLLRLVEVLTGIKNLDGGSPLAYDDTPNLANPLALATVQFVLDNINGGAVTFNAIKWAGIAGETIASGDWVYLKESDGRWYKTAANDITKCRNVRIGRAMGAGTTGNSISGGVFVEGLETVGSYVAGQKYYLSNTAGALSTTPGTENVLIGIGDANTKLLFLNVYDPEAVTYNEKQALQGNVGIPSNTNRFITQDGATLAGVDQQQTTQNSTIEVGEVDVTSRKRSIAQSFTPTRAKIRGVRLWKSTETGTFTGTLSIEIRADNAGSPAASALVSRTLKNSEWNAFLEGSELTALFASELTLTPGTLYWIVISTSTADNSNRPNLGINTAGGYSGGSVKYWNTTDGWVTIATIDLYFKTLEGEAGQVPLTDSTGRFSGDLVPAVNPYPFFQVLPFDNVATGASPSINLLIGATSNIDGSVLFCAYRTTASQSGPVQVVRFQRDNSGQYYRTHTASFSFSVSVFGSTSNHQNMEIGMCVHKDKLLFFAAVTNVRFGQMNAADLTTFQELTISGTAPGAGNTRFMFSDNKYIVVKQNSSDNLLSYTLSGTTITYVNALSDSGLDDPTCAIFDGKDVIFGYATSGGARAKAELRRYAFTPSTLTFMSNIIRDVVYNKNNLTDDSNSNEENMMFLANFNDFFLYHVSLEYLMVNTASADPYRMSLRLLPVTKPV